VFSLSPPSQGTARRKKKVVHRTATTDDKKLQSVLKKLNTNNIPGVDQVGNVSASCTDELAAVVSASSREQAYRLVTKSNCNSNVKQKWFMLLLRIAILLLRIAILKGWDVIGGETPKQSSFLANDDFSASCEQLQAPRMCNLAASPLHAL